MKSLNWLVIAALACSVFIPSVNYADVQIGSLTIKDDGKIVYPDNSTQSTAMLQGSQGPKGDTGPQGPKGDTGPAGMCGLGKWNKQQTYFTTNSEGFKTVQYQYDSTCRQLIKADYFGELQAEYYVTDFDEKGNDVKGYTNNGYSGTLDTEYAKTYQYDSNGRVLSFTLTSDNLSPAIFTYNYNNDGSYDIFLDWAYGAHVYNYDSFNNLLLITYVDGSGNSSIVRQFTNYKYDANNNVISYDIYSYGRKIATAITSWILL